MNNTEPSSRNNFWKTFVLVALIIAVGVFLRLWNLGGESLRLDEAQSVWQASHSASFIATYMLKNVHLPLHNTVLHFWMYFFGSGEVSVRALSLIPGVLALFALFFLAKELFEEKIALLATAIGALSPFWVWYSREIRMYTLLILVTTLSYYFLLRILKTDRFLSYAGYVAVNLIGMYTHYFFFLVLLSQIVFFFTTWKSNFSVNVPEKKKIFIKLILVAVILAAAFFPWAYELLNSYGSGSLAPVLERPTTFNIALSFFEFTFGFQSDAITSTIIALWPAVILLGFVFLSKRKYSGKGMILVCAGILLPIIIVFGVSVLLKPMYLTRYLSIVSPLYYILLAWTLGELRGFGKKAFAFILFLGIAVSLVNQYVSAENPAKEDYREAARYISETVTPRDVVALAPPYVVYPFQYYYRGMAQVTSMPIWDKRKGAIPLATRERIEADAEIVKGHHKRIFLFMADNLEGATEVKDYFDSNLRKLEKRQFSRTLWLHVYQAEYLEEKYEVYYEVVRGDNLSSIAKRFYKNAKKYDVIVEANNIINPHRIEIGDKLLIPALIPDVE